MRYLAYVLAAIMTLPNAAQAQKRDPNEPSFGVAAIDHEVMEPIFKKSKAKLPAECGPMLLDVYQDSPAARAGLTVFDMVLEINDQRVTTAKELVSATSALKLGEPASIRIQKVSGKTTPKWSRKTVKVTPEPRKAVLLGALKATTDDVTRVVFYRHPLAPESHRSGTAVYAYFGVKDGKPLPLQVAFQRRGERFLGIESIDIRIGSELLTIKPAPFAVKSDISGGVSEWYDHDADHALIKAFERGATATVRFNGPSLREDHEMGLQEFHQLKLVIAAREAMAAK